MNARRLFFTFGALALSQCAPAFAQGTAFHDDFDTLDTTLDAELARDGAAEEDA